MEGKGEWKLVWSNDEKPRRLIKKFKKEIIKNKNYYKNNPDEDYVEDITYIYCELGKNCPNDDIFLGCVKTEKYHYASGKVKQEQTCDYQVIKSIYNIN